MSDLDDHDLMTPTTRATNSRTPPKCRHPKEHRVKVKGSWQCLACGHVADPARISSGRRARQRGGRIQRDQITRLGGRNLAGNNPNLDGLGRMFAYESKSGAAFSERIWRWLTGIHKRGNETGVLIVTEAPGRGRKARSYVVVEMGEWEALHGESEE